MKGGFSFVERVFSGSGFCFGFRFRPSLGGQLVQDPFFPALAGEKQHLPGLTQLPEGFQGQGGPLVVKVDQRVVQNDGGLGDQQLADGQPQGQKS